MQDAVVNLNGLLVAGSEARISVFDRGFLFGDSVYEVLRTVRGRPLFWREHMARLVTSAEFLGLDLGATPETLRRRVEDTLIAVPSTEKYIRLIVTRGEGDLSMTGPHGPPTCVVIVRPLSLLAPSFYAEGCALATFRLPVLDAGGLDPRAKTGDKRLGVLAETAARAAGAYEGLRIAADGRVLEGASSTFFLVREGVVVTPALGAGILAGITRAKVLEVAAGLGLAVCEQTLSLEALADADEAFITSTVRGLVPVNRIDARGFGPPGPVTRRLMAAYAACMERSVAEGP